jgi:hypothetical protein
MQENGNKGINGNKTIEVKKEDPTGGSTDGRCELHCS